MLEEANEVQDVLGRSYGMPEIDEDELEGQLDALLDDMALVTVLIRTFKKRQFLTAVTQYLKPVFDNVL